MGAFSESNSFKGRYYFTTAVTRVEAGPWAMVPEAGMVAPISVRVVLRAECDVPATGIQLVSKT